MKKPRVPQSYDRNKSYSLKLLALVFKFKLWMVLLYKQGIRRIPGQAVMHDPSAEVRAVFYTF